MDHILDYSKISNLSRGQRKDRARLDALRHKTTAQGDNSGLTNVDLASLTEEYTSQLAEPKLLFLTVNRTEWWKAPFPGIDTFNERPTIKASTMHVLYP